MPGDYGAIFLEKLKREALLKQIEQLLRLNGSAIGREHVAMLMRRMSIQALYHRPRTSKPLTVDFCQEAVAAAIREYGPQRS